MPGEWLSQGCCATGVPVLSGTGSELHQLHGAHVRKLTSAPSKVLCWVSQPPAKGEEAARVGWRRVLSLPSPGGQIQHGHRPPWVAGSVSGFCMRCRGEEPPCAQALVLPQGAVCCSHPAMDYPWGCQLLLCCCKIQAATFHLVVFAWSFHCTGWDGCATTTLQGPWSHSSLRRGCQDELLLKQRGDRSPPRGSRGLGPGRCVPQR